ncbi:MAG: hypothetical protein JWO43_454 [Candidatus Adlerbacteria bacterium]|nr:hypothetical protein [Candidatus Adlerbacteria bacterium]
MKLLICTQVVDQSDPALGFFHDWITEMSKHCERVVVTCLREGAHNLPANVEVVKINSLGLGRAGRACNFLYVALGRRNDYTHVLVHMNPEYVVVMGALWRAMGKKVGLWYMHKSVTISLRIAALFAHDIFTGSKESFRLATPKLHVMGHGINTEQFAATLRMPRQGMLRIITVGRLSQSKGVVEMLEALDVLHARGTQFEFTIVGSSATEADKVYADILSREVAKRAYKDQVHMLGGIAHAELPQYLARSDIFLNLSRTGSLDKAVLEAMASGVVPVTSNEAFRPILEVQRLWVPSTDAQQVAAAILVAAETDSASLQIEVREHHSLTRLIPAMLGILQ